LGGYLVIDANNNAASIIKSVELKWKNILPDKTFTYTWLDDSLKELYGAEEKMFRVFLFFAALSFFLSCLGLYGLSFFATRQRTREIGIRKVMGAELHHILLLLNKEFIIIIAIAFGIMVPAAWYVANEWLQSFAYREEVSIMVFLISLLVTLSVAIITVSLQALKTILQKPVTALRYQ
jgi:putative ABC transport system permease protein